MNQYRSIFIDQHVLTSPNTIWTVHSIFDKVINLTCSHQMNLLTLTHVSHPRLPYGVHLMPHDFKKVQQQFNVGDQLLLTPCFLQHDSLGIVLQGQRYHSQLVMQQVVQSQNIALLINYLRQLSVRNGFGQTFQESLLDHEHLIKQLVLAKDKSIPLAKLIGRGVGLTPTGDDMVIGYNLAASCLRLPVVIPHYLATTKISQHYLYCSVHGCFHSLLLQLVTLLTEPHLVVKQLQSCIEAILSFGHTSGCDTLTGFILAIFYMKGEN